jgi:hypothetical protein
LRSWSERATFGGVAGAGEKDMRTRPLRGRDSPLSISSDRTAVRLAASTNGSPNFVEEATKSAPPFASSAGRFAILAPVLARTSSVDVIKTEADMFTIDHINELRAELAGCILTRRERKQLEAELAARDAAERAEVGAVVEVLGDQCGGR